MAKQKETMYRQNESRNSSFNPFVLLHCAKLRLFRTLYVALIHMARGALDKEGGTRTQIDVYNAIEKEVTEWLCCNKCVTLITADFSLYIGTAELPQGFGTLMLLWCVANRPRFWVMASYGSSIAALFLFLFYFFV